MTTQLIPLSPSLPLARPIDIYVEMGRSAMRESKAKRTRDAYSSDWKQFSKWCNEHAECPLPASVETVVAYLASMAESGRKVSSMQRHLVSISLAHRAAGFETPPTSAIPVKECTKGYRRVLGVEKQKKLALRKADLTRIFQAVDDPEHPLAVRDRALLLGFASGFRRIELAALSVEDVEFTEHGMVITQRKSKTNQEGKPRRLDFWHGGALCPVKALHKWMDLAEITDGLVFREVHWKNGRITNAGISGENVARRVKHYMRLIGKDASVYGAHSMRRGLCTSLAESGWNELQIMRRSGHRSSAMVREYIEEAGLFKGDNATAALGL